MCRFKAGVTSICRPVIFVRFTPSTRECLGNGLLRVRKTACVAWLGGCFLPLGTWRRYALRSRLAAHATVPQFPHLSEDDLHLPRPPSFESFLEPSPRTAYHSVGPLAEVLH